MELEVRGRQAQEPRLQAASRSQRRQGNPCPLEPAEGTQLSQPTLFFYFWLCWVFGAARRLPLVVVSGGYSLLRCVGFSLRWLLLLWSTDSTRAGSVVVARGL